jgi:hypothetical protein
MDREIDRLLLSPSPCNSSQALSTTTINDPAFTQVDLVLTKKSKI